MRKKRLKFGEIMSTMALIDPFGEGVASGLFSRYRYRYILEALFKLMTSLCVGALCMWCSDYRHSTDTEFDGELINFATQIQRLPFNRWEAFLTHVRCHFNQRESISLKVNLFWVRRPLGGVGAFHAKGWGSQSSLPPLRVCSLPLKPRENKLCLRDVSGMLSGCLAPLGVFKKVVQKHYVLIFWPLA